MVENLEVGFVAHYGNVLFVVKFIYKLWCKIITNEGGLRQ